MSETVYAPFNPDQVASLNAFQESGIMHPFTCTGGRIFTKEAGHQKKLVVDTLGWHCPADGCTYHQAWAHSFMADWSWTMGRPDAAADSAPGAGKPQAVTAVTRARAWLSSDWFLRIVATPLTEGDVCSLAYDAERLELARQVLIDDGFFTAEEVGKDLAPRLTEWLMFHRQAEVDPEEVPDLPCPKCGHEATQMKYCDGCQLRPYTSALGKYADDACRDGDPEHHHRSCLRCSYKWRTNDAIGARKVCAK